MKVWDNRYASALILLVLSFVIYSGFLAVPVFNEDYLVLSWANPATLLDCFRDFFSRQTGGPYWRPVVWSSYFVTKYFFGYEGLVYHLTNLAVYSGICLSLFSLLKKLGIEKRIAMAVTAVFAVLPSHELIYGWIPGRTDSFMALFVLLALNTYLSIKGRAWMATLSATLYLCAILSKETGFAGAALPLLLMIIDKPEKRNIKKALISSATAAALIAAVLAYRFIFIGGTPFESSNFEAVTITKMIINFGIYIPLSFFNADMLDSAYFFMKHNILLFATITLPLIALIIANFIYVIKNRTYDIKLVIFGVLWFCSFIAPATALLMQWYGFVASIGVIIALIGMFRNAKFSALMQINSTVIVILFALATSGGINRSYLWQNAGLTTNNALAGLKAIVPPTADTIMLLGVPDKIDRINSMKIGTEQAVCHTLGRTVTVVSPLRAEILAGAKVMLSNQDSIFTLSLTRGRYIPALARSSSQFVCDEMNFSEDNISINIKNRADATSRARLTFAPSYKYSTYYFDGAVFRKM